MISDFFVVIMTKHLSEQCAFYRDFIGLELIFTHADSVGLGKNDRVFVILKNDDAEDSHHLAEQKGPQIVTFKADGRIENYIENANACGVKIRDTLELPDHGTQYLFLEDFDSNEIALEFVDG